MSKARARQPKTLRHPWVRAKAEPPWQRSLSGIAFTTANLIGELKLQHCVSCETVQYPSREVCQQCLRSSFEWRAVDNIGTVLATSYLSHSQWDYFRPLMAERPWPIVSMSLAGQCMFAHLALHTFPELRQGDRLKTGERVKIFSHTDQSQQSVLIAVAPNTNTSSAEQRGLIVEQLGLRASGSRE